MQVFTLGRLWAYSCSLVLFLLLCNCTAEDSPLLNEVTPEDDTAIGAAIDGAFLHHLDTVPDYRLLVEDAHPALYNYLYQMCAKALNSNRHSALSSSATPSRKPILRVFENQGNTGAFVVPGGYLYIHTDLLKALQYEAELIPILSHLLGCSTYRYDVKKLEDHFSTNFLLDLAIGGSVNGSYASTATNVSAVIDQLERSPYNESEVWILDKLAEDAACELGYDIQVYSSLFMQNTTNELDWFQLFNRGMSNGDYAAHLFNEVSDSLTCNGTIAAGGYPAFKRLIP